MSKTLELVMKHWTTGLPKELYYVDLPFDIESFCRENDELLKVTKEMIEYIKAIDDEVPYDAYEHGKGLISKYEDIIKGTYP